MFFRLLVVSLILFISACETLDDPQALATQGKWFEIGLGDGNKGITSRSLTQLQQLANGASIDFQDYEKGYQQGIENYCHVDNAYSIGLAGIAYHGVCGHLPDGLRFKLEWQRGYNAYKNSL